MQQPTNLTVVVIDNERYGETGMQATHTAHGVDLAAMARCAGFERTMTVTSADQVPGLRAAIQTATGCSLRWRRLRRNR